MNVIGFLYCFVAYWLDKWCLLRGALKPPAYDANLLKTAVLMFPVAAFLHAVVTLWCFGNQNVFPGDWSVLQGFFGGIVNMDEARYIGIIEDYYVASEEGRNRMFLDYLHARLLDFARWSCWLLLCIFLVFCVYYIFSLLNSLFLQPILAPFYTLINGKVRHKLLQQGEAQGTDFHAKEKEMTENGIVPTYNLHKVQRYSVVLSHLHAGQDAVEQARKELETSQAGMGSTSTPSNPDLTGQVGEV
mmetsp:Transcript_11311/g.34059  ORF Transcript_11311/g.34059 Transcript_11311/m.34059 type:complete len:245 (-) Transcript_11311:25-759(-)